MYKITEKVALNPTVTKMVIEAPLIAKKAKPGQFIIVRPFEDSERIPLTVAGYDREKGTVDIIFQIVGGTTMELNSLEVGQSVHDFVGPLGRATEVEGLKKVCVVGGGVGCAIALPIARELHEQGCVVHSVVGFRSKDLLILEDEFKACSDELRVMTDDGSYGTKGVVTAALDELALADEEMRSEFSPALAKSAASVLSRLTGGAYTELTLDRELNALVRCAGEPVLHESAFLSRGTADQLYLALRLALCDMLLGGEDPCPIVLDDALINFDDARMGYALDYLAEIAQHRQILLFSCHSREKRYIQAKNKD